MACFLSRNYLGSIDHDLIASIWESHFNFGGEIWIQIIVILLQLYKEENTATTAGVISIFMFRHTYLEPTIF